MIKIRSYIKLYGPSISKAREALTEFCLKNSEVELESLQLPIVPQERSSPFLKVFVGQQINIVDWSFSFEWKKEPSIEDIKILIKKLDDCIAPTGAKYTITTISDPLAPPIPESAIEIPLEVKHPYAITFLKIYGPPIHKSFEIVDRIVSDYSNIVSGQLLTSRSGPQLGLFDFALVWSSLPNNEVLFELEQRFDEEFEKAGLNYTIQNRSYE